MNYKILVILWFILLGFATILYIASSIIIVYTKNCYDVDKIEKYNRILDFIYYTMIFTAGGMLVSCIMAFVI